MTHERLRALVVSYMFPPTGGAGVQRVTKLVKYLPEHEIDPSVLTVSNPSVPLRDDSLCRELPAEVDVVRTRTLEPGYAAKRVAWTATAAHEPGTRERLFRAVAAASRRLLFPDPQVLWQPSAQACLLARLARRADDVVFVTGPPFSQFLLGATARVARGVGVVLDYRDEWRTVQTAYEMAGGHYTERAAAALEARLVRAAHVITTATEGFRRSLVETHRLDPSRVVTIPNGYDPADLPETRPEPPVDRFVVTHAGTVFRLTSPAGFLEAVRRLRERRPDLARHLEVRFVGRVVESELGQFDDEARIGVRRLGYVSHPEALKALLASHLVLCVLDDVAGVAPVYPAKIFELMALGRPCLTLAPDGLLSDLVRRHGAGTVIAPRDVEAIAVDLEARLEAFVRGDYPVRSRVTGVERYDRRRLAGDFADAFRDAVHRARETDPRRSLAPTT